MGSLACDLRKLWRLAYLEHGGFDAVSAAGAWTLVAEGLGADTKRTANAASVAKQWYHRFLLPLERHFERQAAAK